MSCLPRGFLLRIGAQHTQTQLRRMRSSMALLQHLSPGRSSCLVANSFVVISARHTTPVANRDINLTQESCR